MKASFQDVELQCPSTRFCDAVTLLRDFAIITYSIEPAKLSEQLPKGIEPDVYRLDSGKEVAFISAVPFRDKGFHFAGFPFLRFGMGQINYRAYVLHEGRRCVWFFGTSLTGPTVFIPRHCWKLPWHPAKMKFDVSWDGDVCRSYNLESKSKWCDSRVRLSGTAETLSRLDGFETEEETKVVLTHPLKGLFYRRDGKVGSYSIWHDKLDLYLGRVEKAKFELFESLGLVLPDAEPHSVLLQRETEFIIKLPPVVVSE